MPKPPVRKAQSVNRLLDAALTGEDGEWTCDALADAQSGARPGLTGFRLLIEGEEAFLARAFLIARAQRTLDLQYYLFRADTSGALLSNSILQAADRGVRVRLLVDGWSMIWRDAQSAWLNMHPNVEIRLFNPVAEYTDGALARLLTMLTNPRRINRRMHNKVFIADGRLVLLGGRNVSDRYFGIDRNASFRDLDVLCSGALVREICTSFDAYWNSAAARPLRSVGIKNRSAAELARFRNRLSAVRKHRRISGYERQLSNTALAHSLSDGDLRLIWAKARLIVDRPDKVSQLLIDQASPLEQLLELAESARRELLLVSPYFVPGERGMSVLATLRARGIRVVLVTNSLASTDIVVVHTGYRRYRERLLKIGVEIHEIRASVDESGKTRKLFRRRASLHAKAYVFDATHVVIGSLNLDPRSMFLNTEIGVLVSNVLLANDVIRCISVLSSQDCSYRVRLEGEAELLVWEGRDNGEPTRCLREPGASVWRRLVVWLLSWLPIEDQL